MADVLLFHHALGLTAGVLRFAERLRAGGHRVSVPDLFDGQIFGSIDQGVVHAERVGFEQIINRGVTAAADLPGRCVYAGFSLGSLPAQKLAQTRAGALGAILYHGGIPSSTFSAHWPVGVQGDRICRLAHLSKYCGCALGVFSLVSRRRREASLV